ncbi:MAG: hypothetical protein HY579_11850 [Nitrospinae bacterium]|nr:hypothetical protein [Nitrospinota bacterium]
MFQFAVNGRSVELSLTTRILIGFAIGLGLVLLAFFAFAFFIAVLIAGAGLFLLNLFRRPRTAVPPDRWETPPQPTRPFRHFPRRDDDVIDV